MAAEVIRDELDAGSAGTVGDAAMPADGDGRPPTDEVAVLLAAFHHAAGEDRAELSALLLRYREALEDAGLRPPGSGREDDGVLALADFRRYRKIAEVSYRLLDTADELRLLLAETRTIT